MNIKEGEPKSTIKCKLFLNRFFFIAFLSCLVVRPIFGQETAFTNPMEKGLVFKFTDDGKYFVKMGCAMELWTRFIQYNPNTKDFSGDNIDYDFDFVLRRIYVPTVIKLDRFTGYAGLGTSTQAYTTSASPYTTTKPAFYFYDMWASYEAIPDYLRIGYGLSLYKGLSRYSSASAARSLGADVPMLAAPDVLTTDQTARNLGFFVAGNIKAINYRLMIGKPFVVNATNRQSIGVDKAADVPNNHTLVQGYADWQFLENESGFLPFFSSTHLGKKKVFNIGAGFYYHPNSTQSITADGLDTLTHNKFHFAVDVFLDYPMASGGVLTAYGAYFHYNYGPNYFMNGGAANVLATPTAPASGITEPNFGTGSAIATQLAWMFPKTFGKAGRLQVYYEGNYMFFEALDDAALHHNFGINYYILGQNLKLTAEYEMRPYMENKQFDSYKGMVIIKTQVSF
jgi:hypothetical protein